MPSPTVALNLLSLRRHEKIGDRNAKSSGEFRDGRERGLAFAAENLGQVPFREVGFEIGAVERAVLLDNEVAHDKAATVACTPKTPPK